MFVNHWKNANKYKLLIGEEHFMNFSPRERHVIACVELNAEKSRMGGCDCQRPRHEKMSLAIVTGCCQDACPTFFT